MPPATFTFKSFFERMNDVDPDLRQMALFDLYQELGRDTFVLGTDEEKVLQVVMACFTAKESNSEVHSNAVRLLEVLVPKMEGAKRDRLVLHLANNMHKAIPDAINDKLRTIRDNSSLSLKSIMGVVGEKQVDCIVTLVKNLIEGLASADVRIRTEAFDVLAEASKRFGPHIKAHHSALIAAAIKDLNAPGMLRKRAATCLATLCEFCSPELFDSVLTLTLTGLQNDKGEALRRHIQLCTAVSRAAGTRFSQWIGKVTPCMFAELDRLSASQDDERESAAADETRENILQAMENFVSRCPNDVTELMATLTAHCVLLLKWDPNYDDEMCDDEMFEDDEEDDEFIDEDDSSWKVRKSAARCLHEMVRSRSDLAFTVIAPQLLQPAAPFIVSRFNERVENVRLGVLELFGSLLDLCKAGTAGAAVTSGSYQFGSYRAVETRSEVAMLQPVHGAVLQSLIRAAAHKSPKVKLAVFVQLRQLFSLIGHELGAAVQPCVDITIAHLQDPRLALPHLRPDVLHFACSLTSTTVALAKTDPTLIPHVERLLDVVLACTEDRYFRTVIAAVKVCNEFVAVLRMSANEGELAKKLFGALFARLSTSDSDQDVRRASIEGTAKLLKYAEKTLSKLIPAEIARVYEQLLALLKNETTRIITARAVQTIQKCAIPAAVVQGFAGELATFLRKTDRQVREEGLRTLAQFVPLHAGTISAATFKDIVGEMTSETSTLLSDRELFLTSLSLQLARTIAAIPEQAKNLAATVVPRVLTLLLSPLTQGHVVKEAADFFGAMAVSPAVDYAGLLKKVVDTVTAAANDNAPIANLAVITGVVVAHDKDAARLQKTVLDFCAKASGASVAASCMGVAVIGEVGRHADLSALQGAAATLTAALSSQNDEVKMAAASALGRASSKNSGAKLFMDVFAGVQATASAASFFYLRAVKEAFVSVVADGGDAPQVLKANRAAIFAALLAHSSTSDESIAEVTAECLGRFAQIDHTVVADLAAAVGGASQEQRGTILWAVRFTMSNQANANLDKAVGAHLGQFLAYLGQTDQVVRNRFCAVQLFMAAGVNRPQLLLNDTLRQVYLPALLKETRVDKALITTVDLGPFKHVVDKGLELRKQAFECLGSLVDGFHRANSVIAHGGDFDVIVQHTAASLAAPVEADLDINSSARLTIVKLSKTSGGAPVVVTHLDQIADLLKGTVGVKAKDGQDADKVEDSKTSAIVAALRLAELPGAKTNVKFAELLKVCHASAKFEAARAIAAE
jgi:cullin-associated NEDD8-dissociated protein 1